MPIQVTMDDIPVFMPEGRIAPIFDDVGHSARSTLGKPITLVIAPDMFGTASGTLYLDDGETFDFKQGEFLHVRFSLAGRVLKCAPFALNTHVPELFVASRVSKIVLYEDDGTRTFDVDLKLADGEWTWEVPPPESQLRKAVAATLGGAALMSLGLWGMFGK